ncbi:D-2-hydroxyacid dehydrogenase [Photobacterium damselae subsp. piscicida]|nr:D-2-hydroxyacid dehydrogenase [Photobacterium damselae subsp. piscicida]
MHKLAIVSRQQQAYERLLAATPLPLLEITNDPKKATIILANPPEIAAYLDDYPQLKWLQSTFAGIDALTKPQLRQDYHLTNVRGCFGPLIAEYVFGQWLSHSRHFPLYSKQQQQHQWHPLPYQSIAGKTLVIIGTGSIGQHLAQVAKAFHCQVIGVNRHGNSPCELFDCIYATAQLSQALEQADVIVSVVPATSDTTNLFNHQTFSHCHQALLFNVGRGNAVNIANLYQALDRDQIRHAYLDVFKTEPLEQNSKLWGHPQISITPHIAAESFPEQVIEIFKINYIRWLNNQTLNYQIDFRKGY